MGMINSNDLKEGVIFKDAGNTYLVLNYDHIKKGRGQATIKVKVKNIETNANTILSYTNEQKVEDADVIKKSAQFLYKDENGVNFMDSEDYSQFSISIDMIEDLVWFLKEGQKVIVMYLEGNPITIELPKVIELKVVETSAAVSGNTVSGAMKDAKLETGVNIKVPLFIENNEVIKVNTESKSYVSRVT